MIAAVLETAGQVTQAHILQDFNQFFHSAGAFLYILAAMGGILSFVLFNSFRMVRYMLVGPTIFWFLVGVGHDSQGAVWELADGTQHSPDPVFSGTTPLANYKPAGPIRISWVFSVITDTINEVVSELTKVVLHQKKDNQLMFVARNRAFENLINAKIAKPELLSMIEDNLLSENCGKMMNYSLALSNILLSPTKIGTDYDIDSGQSGSQAHNSPYGACDIVASGPYEMVGELELHLATAQQAGAQTQISELTNALNSYFTLKQDYCAKYNFYKDETGVTVNPATLQFMRTVQEEPGFVQNFLDTPSGNPGGGYNGRRICTPSDNPQPNCINAVKMTCGQLWNVTQQAVLKEAEWFSSKLMYEVKPRDSAANEDQILCRALWTKVHPNDPIPPLGSCNLVDAAAIFLIRNSISERMGDRVNQMVKNRVPSMAMLDTVEDGTIALADQNGDSTEGHKHYYVKDPQYLEFKPGDDGQVLVLAYEIDDKGNRTNTKAWVPYARIGQISGQMDAAFDEHQAYQTRGLRQQIFTWAMQLPYYQGVILYLISVAYPFMCLVVLVPGRAGAILAVPMAWLWVKSWDLGFAMVMVLDDILWNMFPQRDIGVNLGAGSVPVEQAMTEAFKIDPSYNVHGYYFFVSMCLMAVPAITGYATMKSRSSVLASFVDGPRSQSKDAADRAEGSYGIQRMNQRVRQERETRGMAMLSKSGSLGAMMGQGRGMTSAGWAIAQGAGKGLSSGLGGNSDNSLSPEQEAKWRRVNARNRRQGKPQVSKRAFLDQHKRLANRQGLAKAVTDGLAEMPKAFGSMLSTEVNHASHQAAAFDERFGRFGTYQMMQDAAAAAMDGAGGFEINDSDRTANAAINQKITLFSTRLQAFQKITGDAVDALTGLMGQGARSNTRDYSTKELIINAAPAAWGIADRYAPEITHAVEGAIEDGANAIFDKLGIGSFQSISRSHYSRTTTNRTYGDFDLYDL